MTKREKLHFKSVSIEVHFFFFALWDDIKLRSFILANEDCPTHDLLCTGRQCDTVGKTQSQGLGHMFHAVSSLQGCVFSFIQ